MRAHDRSVQGLPEGWENALAGDLFDLINGFAFKPAQWKDRGLPIIRIQNLNDPTASFNYCPDKMPAKYLVNNGDLLFAWSGTPGTSFGAHIWHGGQGWLNQHIFRVEFDQNSLNKRFLQLAINHNLDDYIDQAHGGVGLAHITKGRFEGTSLMIPPLAEQKRIVAKVEELLARVNAGRVRLDRAPRIMKRFRQAVLAAACSGRLTEGWREENPDVEPGTALLSRIKKARLAKALTAKEKRQMDEAFRAEEEGLECDDFGFDAIPESWVGCLLGAIGEVVNGSTPSRKQPELWDGDVPWVSSGEVRNNIIVATRERITKAGYESCSVHLLPTGTVLLAMIGEGKTRGQSAILHIEATINQNIAAIVIPHGLVRSEFLWRWLQFQYEATRERGSGSGPQALNCQRVRELPFVLPPIAEQLEIVRRVEDLFKLADAIEKRVAAARLRADKLTQSVLAKAFRGELVPTEAELARQEGRSYEPASVLLERIRAEREKGKPQAKKRRP